MLYGFPLNPELFMSFICPALAHTISMNVVSLLHNLWPFPVFYYSRACFFFSLSLLFACLLDCVVFRFYFVLYLTDRQNDWLSLLSLTSQILFVSLPICTTFTINRRQIISAHLVFHLRGWHSFGIGTMWHIFYTQ